ncbi:MAG: hypothetical protein PSV24_02120 [Rhodoferax sp.]|nr:hypothetical protein [Rhodoferax sp.]
MASYSFSSSYGGDHSDHASFQLTRHAAIRVQQRGVQREVLDCLLTYGHHEPDHKGCNVVTFDSRAIEDLSRFESRSIHTKASHARKLYAVIDSDGVVITTGHRFRRVPRDLSLSSLRPGRSSSHQML